MTPFKFVSEGLAPSDFFADLDILDDTRPEPEYGHAEPIPPQAPDWLLEQDADDVPCPECGGAGWFGDDLDGEDRSAMCERCRGTGEVLVGY